MLNRLYASLKGFVGRVTEVTGVLLALFAAYEAALANRIAPHVTGAVWVCPTNKPEWATSRAEFSNFLRANGDSVVYLDLWFQPVEYDLPEAACREDGQTIAALTDDGLRVTGTPERFEDGATGAVPEFQVSSSDFDTPQTARLTAQYGEEPVYGISGLVYLEAGEPEMGFQTFSVSAAPYADAMLKKRDCTRDFLEADGWLAKGHAYLFSCLTG